MIVMLSIPTITSTTSFWEVQQLGMCEFTGEDIRGRETL